MKSARPQHVRQLPTRAQRCFRRDAENGRRHAPLFESVLAALLLAAFSPFALAADANSISLAGQWRFQLDRADVGINERWFARELPERIHLPGSLPEQGIGDDISTNTPWTGGIVDKSWFTAPEYAKYRKPGNVKVPYWLQPEKYYKGAAWYQLDIEIPKDWAGKRVVLFLERAHWETRVWLDDRLIGTNDSLATPHEHDLGQPSPGKHTLTIRVDNRMIVDIGENSHAVSDHTQGNWNGIVGKIELRTTPLVWIEDLQVFPHVTSNSVTVKGTLVSTVAAGVTNRLKLHLIPLAGASGGATERLLVVCNSRTTEFQAEIRNTYPMMPWDEFQGNFIPNLIVLTATTGGDWPNVDVRRVRSAFRAISTDGTKFLINSNKTFLRGTLECCIFPKTGHPPMEVNEWKRIIRVAKAHGLNLFRFHSWCPPEAAFQAADELGFYFQIEPCWPNQSTALGDGKPVDDWIYRETDRILKAYGNHPSFLLMTAGNEPGGRNANAYLAKYVAHYKALDPRRLWTTGSGWPQLSENQFHVTPDPRIQAWGAGLRSRINAQPPETVTDYRDYITRRSVPVISHEIGQWCVYPNFEEIPKYTGYLKPKNFEIFRDSLDAHGMGDLAKQFLLASGKLQALCYKEDIESALRTPGMSGFELLDLHDFPGQGTALVGVLDPFWEEKGYVTANEFSRFCNSTVPLARLKKRVFTTDEKLEAELELSHFGASPMKEAVAAWKLVDEHGKVMVGGQFLGGTNVPFGQVEQLNPPVNTFPGNGITIPIGSSRIGAIAIDLKSVPSPGRYNLVVGVGEWLYSRQKDFVMSSFTTATAGDRLGASSRRGFENDWDIWVYPPKVDTAAPTGVTVVNEFNADAQRALASGGKVLLLIPPKRVRNDSNAPVALGFSSIFWNTAWTHRQAPTTLGILCDPKHPLFADFPTQFHSNWQWWYLIRRASPMILDDLPRDLLPTVQVIDDWVTNRKLGLVFEAKVGKGKLIVCSIDLEHDLDNDPVTRQFRASLLRYMASDRFDPKVSVTAQQIARLVAE